jgi:transposase InsO family protein
MLGKYVTTEGRALGAFDLTHQTMAALPMALARRVVEAGLVHHSDRGSQYASND